MREHKTQIINFNISILTSLEESHVRRDDYANKPRPGTGQVTSLRPSFLLTLAHQTDGLRTLCLDCSHDFFVFSSPAEQIVSLKLS